MKVRTLLLAGIFCFASHAAAQDQTAQVGRIDPTPAQGEVSNTFPKSLGGNWDHVTMSRPYGGRWGVKIDETKLDGTLVGKVTFEGISCRAFDEPITAGKYDEKRLEIEVKNVGQCGRGKFTLTRVSSTRWEGNYDIEKSGSGTKKVFLEAR